MKKKLISLILCGVMAFALVSCGDSKEKETSSNSNKTTTSSSANSKVDTEDSDDKKEESTSSKDEYKTMTTEEAIKFNNEKVYEIQEMLNKNGLEAELDEYSKDEIDGPVTACYINENGDMPYYNWIGYDAEILENKGDCKI